MRAIRSRLPASLRWRLTAWVAGVMLVSAAVVFGVVYINTGTQIQGQIDHDLAGNTTQLTQALKPLEGQAPDRIAAGVDRYVRAQPFSATSTLLFVRVPDAGTVSNHPEVFGSQTAESGETASGQALERRAGELLLTPRLGYSIRRVPDVGRMRVLERAVPLGPLRLVVGAGEALAMVSALSMEWLERSFWRDR